jgi:hypothetical protein
MHARITTDVWSNLKDKTAENDNMVKTIKINADLKIFLFIASDNSYNINIELQANSKSTKLINPNVSGLTTEILNRVYVTGSSNRENFINVRCNKHEHLELFTRLVNEILQLIIDENNNSLIATNYVIKKYQSFWKQLRQPNILSFEEEIGLFAELNTLLHLLKLLPANMAVDSWKGQERYKYDFDFPNLSIETKGTLKTEHEHVINGLEQLSTRSNATLLLVSSKLTHSTESYGHNLTNLVNQINAEIQDNFEAYELFTTKLQMTKFNYEHNDYYSFFLVNTKVYIVDENFPIITHDSFVNPLSRHIKKVNYTINLEGFSGLSLTSSKFQEIMEQSINK